MEKVKTHITNYNNVLVSFQDGGYAYPASFHMQYALIDDLIDALVKTKVLYNENIFHAFS